MLPDKRRFCYLDFTDGGIFSFHQEARGILADRARGMWIMRRSSSLVTLYCESLRSMDTRTGSHRFVSRSVQMQIDFAFSSSIVRPKNGILSALSIVPQAPRVELFFR